MITRNPLLVQIKFEKIGRLLYPSKYMLLIEFFSPRSVDYIIISWIREVLVTSLLVPITVFQTSWTRRMKQT